jgi:hypothetical protein
VSSDHRFQRSCFAKGKIILGPTARTREMDVLAFTRAVVPGALLEMGVLHHSDLLEHGQGSIDGGDIHGRHPPLDPAGHCLRSDVTLGPHHLSEDRLTLWSEPPSIPPKPRHDVLDTLHPSRT